MVTVVTIKTGQGAVSKTPSPSSQCLSSPQKNPQILRRPDGECFRDHEPSVLRVCKMGTICKPQQRLPKKPHSPYPLGEPTILCSRRMKVS
jgi:hypothetical protein